MSPADRRSARLRKPEVQHLALSDRAGHRSCQGKLAIYARRYDDTGVGSGGWEPCPNQGPHNTSIPGLTLHRRSGPTEPLHCIYNLGLGVVAQGDKQVLLGEESIDYGPGQSMLTTIDLPVVSHVTRASGAEPFLGMMLTLDVRSIVPMASEMDEPRPGARTPLAPSRPQHRVDVFDERVEGQAAHSAIRHPCAAEVEIHDGEVVAQIFTRWNRLTPWFGGWQRLEQLHKALNE